jgi:hypothetical protein
VPGFIVDLPDGERWSLVVSNVSLSVGRAKGNDVVINSGELSRRHLTLSRASGGELVLNDLGTANGTFVNGVRISGAHLVKPGDVVTIGRFTMRAVGSESELAALRSGVGHTLESGAPDGGREPDDGFADEDEWICASESFWHWWKRQRAAKARKSAEAGVLRRKIKKGEIGPKKDLPSESGY